MTTTPTTQREADELLPCPFCGGAPKLEETRDTGPGIWFQPKPWPATSRACHIHCCHARVYKSWGLVKGDEDDARTWAFKLASDGWNRRAAIDQSPRQAAPEAPAAATDQPSAGQVDERALLRDWEWALEKKGVHVSRGESSAFLEGVRKARASLTPTAPQAASQQAGDAVAWRFREYDDQEKQHSSVWQVTTDPAAIKVYESYNAIVEPLGVIAPQAATTASASIDGNLLAEMDWCIANGFSGIRTREVLKAARAALARAPLPAQTDTPEIKTTPDADEEMCSRRVRNFRARINPTREPDFVGEKSIIVTYNGKQEYTTALAPHEARQVFDLIAVEYGFTAPVQAVDVARDAARYRFIRAQNWNGSEMAVVCHPKKSVKLGFDCPSGERLDAAIDVAIKAHTKAREGA